MIFGLGYIVCLDQKSWNTSNSESVKKLSFNPLKNNEKLEWKNYTLYIIECLSLEFISKDDGNFVLISERVSGQSKEMPLVIYLAFLAIVANLYYLLLTAFRKYWPDTVAKFISGTQETFI